MDFCLSNKASDTALAYEVIPDFFGIYLFGKNLLVIFKLDNELIFHVFFLLVELGFSQISLQLGLELAGKKFSWNIFPLRNVIVSNNEIL